MLIWLSHSAHIFNQTLFWMFLRGCFWMRFTFKLVNCEESRLPSIMWSLGLQSAENPNRTKGWPYPSMRGFNQQTAFGHELQLNLQPDNLSHQILDSPSLCNYHKSQFLNSLSLLLYLLFVLFLWRTLTSTVLITFSFTIFRAKVCPWSLLSYIQDCKG